MNRILGGIFSGCCIYRNETDKLKDYYINFTKVWSIPVIELPQRCDESHHYKQIHF